jgi:hypothetical protein
MMINSRTSILKIAIALCMLLAPVVLQAADGVSYLYITMTDNSETVFALADNPVVTVSGTTFLATCGSQSVSADLTSVKNYHFSNTTGISSIQSSKETVLLQVGQAVISGVKAGTEVRIVSVDGKVVMSRKAAANGSLTIDLSTLGRGVYVLSTPTTKLKMMINH